MRQLFKTFALFIMVALTAALVSHHASAVTVISSKHFEAGKNLSAGNKHSKSDKHLAELLIEVENAANSNTATLAKYVKYTAAATAGGAATQVVAVTGLGASDTILSVSQRVKGANSLPLLGYQGQAANSLTLVYSADPGAGAVVEVFVKKP